MAGGIYFPATDETFLGSIDSGVTYNGKPAQPSLRKNLEGALVLRAAAKLSLANGNRLRTLLSKSGPWVSMAYKLALVSTRLADVTFTLTPKNEWDVAAGRFSVECRRFCKHSGEPCAGVQFRESVTLGFVGLRSIFARRASC